MKRDEKGYITLLLMVLIAFGFLLSGGLMSLLQQTPTTAGHYVLVNPTPYPSHQTLQLATLSFVYIPQATTCDPDPQHKLGSGEPYILYAAEPGSGDIAAATDTIKAWVIDEHPMTLGVNPGVSSIPASQQQANPNVGDQTKRDANNLPIFPALYLTNITNNPTDTSGDAQNGGTPIQPSIVSGSWKAMNATDPATHNYPNGGLIDPLPAQSNVGHDISENRDRNQLYYSTEVGWNISDLINKGVLQAGNTYRAQFIVHDGDDTGSGGDLGYGCTTIQLVNTTN